MSNIVLPNTLTNGQPNDASEVMANFAAILAVVNGDIDLGNLATSGKNAFLKLKVAADLHLAYVKGNTTLDGTAGLSRKAFAVAHTLGVTPVLAWCSASALNITEDAGAVPHPVFGSVDARDATNCTLIFEVNGTSTNSFEWELYAIG